MPCDGCVRPLRKNAWRDKRVSEVSDSRISDLYQQSSQETPPAHVDRAVLDRARKSVRPRAFSPFGNHWVAGGALASVVVLSVLLILILPRQQESYAPGQDAMAPSADALPEMQREARSQPVDDAAAVLDAPVLSSHALAETKSATAASRPESPALAGNALAPSGDAPSGLPTGAARVNAMLPAPQMKTEQRRQPTAMPGARFNFTGKSQDADATMPEEEARPDIRWAPAVPTGRNAFSEKSQDNNATIAEEEARADIRPAPAIPKGRDTFSEESQAMVAAMPAEEARAPGQQSPAPASEEPAGTTAPVLPVSYYLQVGAFREQQRAIQLQKKLSRMGFKSEIQQVSVDDTGVYHRLRVGPFSNPEELARTKLKLYALGIESRTLKE